MTALPPPDRRHAWPPFNNQSLVLVNEQWIECPPVPVRHPGTCQCATPNFDDIEQCRRCLRLDLRAPRAAALAAAYDARHGPTAST